MFFWQTAPIVHWYTLLTKRKGKSTEVVITKAFQPKTKKKKVQKTPKGFGMDGCKLNQFDLCQGYVLGLFVCLSVGITQKLPTSHEDW